MAADSSVVRELEEQVVERSRPILANSNYNGKPIVLALSAVQSPCGKFPTVKQDIELFDHDTGAGGCWFRCKVLLASNGLLKVEHKDVMQPSGEGNMKEWVPACTEVASSDKLGMRWVGRLTVRPQRCMNSSSGTTFTVGAAVDVWHCSGWWEGVVLGYETLTNTNTLPVYIPGENSFFTAKRKNIRVSKDWFNSNWMDIRPRNDIVSFLSSISSPFPKITPLVVTAATLEEPEANKRKVPSSAASTCRKSAEKLNLKKRLISRYNEDNK